MADDKFLEVEIFPEIKQDILLVHSQEDMDKLASMFQKTTVQSSPLVGIPVLVYPLVPSGEAWLRPYKKQVK